MQGLPTPPPARMRNPAPRSATSIAKAGVRPRSEAALRELCAWTYQCHFLLGFESPHRHGTSEVSSSFTFHSLYSQMLCGDLCEVTERRLHADAC